MKKVTELAQIAHQEGVTPRYVRRILNLAFLAPNIVEMILRGDSPPTLTLEELQKGIPADWGDQHKWLGINQDPAL